MGQNSSLSWLFLVVAISEWVCVWTVARQDPLSVEFSGKNTGVDCHFLLQGISRPREWTRVSCLSYACSLVVAAAAKSAPKIVFDNVISVGEKSQNVQCSSSYWRCYICHPSTDGLVSHSHTHLLYTYYLFCSLTPCQRLQSLSFITVALLKPLNIWEKLRFRNLKWVYQSHTAC